MNFLELQDLVLVWVDDINAGYFTRPQVKRFLNNALYEVQKQLIQSNDGYYLRAQQTSCVVNQDAYSLPADFLKVRKLEVCASGPGDSITADVWQMLLPCSIVEALSVPLGPALPTVYYLKKDCLVMRSIPDNDYPLRLLYDYRVSEMTSDSEIPDCPTEYQEYIAVLATLDCFLRDQRDPGPFLEKKKYYQDLMLAAATQRRIDQPRHVIQTQGSSYDWLY